MGEKTIQYGDEGEELVPGKTENLSSILHGEGDAALPEAHIGAPPRQGHERDQFDRRENELPEGSRRR